MRHAFFTFLLSISCACLVSAKSFTTVPLKEETVAQLIDNQDTKTIQINKKGELFLKLGRVVKTEEGISVQHSEEDTKLLPIVDDALTVENCFQGKKPYVSKAKRNRNRSLSKKGDKDRSKVLANEF